MGYSILFVVVLILISGFIAYFGDLLGRKMGKRRLTLLRLRPRYTAILFTVLTGMIIATVALLALIAANSQFKRVLIEGETILSQNDSLKRSNRELDRQNIDLADKGKSLADEATMREAEAKKARAEASKSLQAMNAAQETVRRLESEIGVRQSDLEKLKKSSSVTKAQLQNSQQQLDRVQTSLQVAKQRLKKAEEQYVSTSMDLRSGILILRQGDEITRGVINTRQSSANIKSDLRKLLNSSSERAIELGAAKGANARAVSVIFRQKISESLDYLMRNESLFINKAAEAITHAGSHDQVLVQVVCARNTLRQEQVPVELKLYPNDVIYRKNQKITEGKIDGRQSEGRILMDLIGFLQNIVGSAALKAGVVPVTGTASKSSSQTDALGQVEALMTTVDRIQSANAPVALSVSASKDIRAEGPLNMDNMQVEVRKL